MLCFSNDLQSSLFQHQPNHVRTHDLWKRRTNIGIQWGFWRIPYWESFRIMSEGSHSSNSSSSGGIQENKIQEQQRSSRLPQTSFWMKQLILVNYISSHHQWEQTQINQNRVVQNSVELRNPLPCCPSSSDECKVQLTEEQALQTASRRATRSNKAVVCNRRSARTLDTHQPHTHILTVKPADGVLILRDKSIPSTWSITIRQHTT